MGFHQLTREYPGCDCSGMHPILVTESNTQIHTVVIINDISGDYHG